MRTSYYPNLELIEYKFKSSLHSNVEWNMKFQEARKNHSWAYEQYSVRVFPQLWSSTATAFDVMPDGSPAIAGCAMTEAYTTVIHEEITDAYGVFIGNEPCYMVMDATDVFYEDLKNCNMRSLSNAKKFY